MTTKPELADLLIERLNEILKHDPNAVAALIETRVPCSQAMTDHPTVQVHADGTNPPRLGVLGLINGIVGAQRNGLGFICAVYDDDGKLLRFSRTDGKGVVFPDKA